MTHHFNALHGFIGSAITFASAAVSAATEVTALQYVSVIIGMTSGLLTIVLLILTIADKIRKWNQPEK